VADAIKCLPNERETLSSNPNTAKNKQTKKSNYALFKKGVLKLLW
jgi:hypothetical protein